MFLRISSFFWYVVNVSHIDVCACVYICMVFQVYMYSCACSLWSNRIDLCPVMTCEYWQESGDGKTALLWASEGGHADTVRVLVELGASVEAVDKVNIHAPALANTCGRKHEYNFFFVTIFLII